MIFVHGCFWHSHDCRSGRNRPVTNFDYWARKLERNQERDKVNLQKLKELGWDVFIAWECELKRDGFRDSLLDFVYRPVE